MSADRDDYSAERLQQLVPMHLQAGLMRWIEDGIRPGDGLWSILINAPASEVISRLDEISLAGLPRTLRFLVHGAPIGCWGSEAKCEAWRERGGLNGRPEP